MGYRPLVVLCLPLADLHHFRLTKGFLKLPAASSRSERHLQFALIRLCLALLFIISINLKMGGNKKSYLGNLKLQIFLESSFYCTYLVKTQVYDKRMLPQK